MISFFRRTRKQMADDNKPVKYMRYAVGEVVLVVIGILIALQINNQNELSKERNRELHYLKNIRTDLYLNIAEIDRYIDTRSRAIESANIILEHFEGKPLTDLPAFSEHTINIYTWRKFFQNNNTFQELTNSGNLALISNDSIKTTLLNMELLYKIMKDEEAHFRYDAEVLLYEPSYGMIDLHYSIKSLTYRLSNGQAGEDVELPREQYEMMLKDIKQKNGFAMAVYEFGAMNVQLEKMKVMCQDLLVLIDEELSR